MNLKSTVRILILVLTTNIQISSYAQFQNVNFQLFNEETREFQLNRKFDSLVSFCVRPVYSPLAFDSGNYLSHSSKQINLLPIVLKQQYNTNFPYEWNDGSMISAKGYQTQLSLGAYFKKGIFSLQLQPELVFAQNSSFQTFPSQQNDTVWKTYYNTVLNLIDAPERFGSKPYLKLFPGQSSFRINYRKLSLGISTENLWWGPGVRNSLVMSNNAPGFPHLSFNSSQPLASSIGSFEWQLISGQLKSSGILPDTTRKFNGRSLYVPKPSDDRYLNGLIVTWQPKWTKGLFIGFSRVFYQYQSDVPSTFNGYLPVFGKLFKRGLTNEDEKKRDQMLSLFFRFILPAEKAEFYAEYGRNDHSQNSRDLLLEPEHSRAYIIGFSKTFERSSSDMRLFGEIANLQMPSTILLRAQESWYTHYQVRDGYTNYGQVIGAGIGPGSSCQTFGLDWGHSYNKIGGTIERVVHNNDFYYSAFAPTEQWQKHWVDLSLNLNKSWIKKRIVYDAGISFINSLNYEWYFKNVFNASVRFQIAYLF